MDARLRRAAFAIVFAVAGLLVIVLVGTLPPNLRDGDVPGFDRPGFVAVASVAVVSVIALALWIALRDVPSEPGAPRRAAVEAPETSPAAHPYRGYGGPALPRSPRASTRSAVLLVVACMSFTALALPFAVHLPRWLEAEVVVGAWWLTWAVVLAVLAYRGRPLDETHELAITSPFRGGSKDAGLDPPPKRRRWLSWADLSFDAGGLLVALAVAFVIGVGLVAAWVVVELAAPTVFFIAYLGIAKALRRARAASLRGDLVRSALHGALWATAYVVPLATGIMLLHATIG